MGQRVLLKSIFKSMNLDESGDDSSNEDIDSFADNEGDDSDGNSKPKKRMKLSPRSVKSFFLNSNH